MIIISLGSNLNSLKGRPPAENLKCALKYMIDGGISILNVSTFYESAPIPDNGSPWYINAVGEVSTNLKPRALLKFLHEVETRLGRLRSEQNAPRIIDLDIIDYHGRLIKEAELTLPHPRMTERAFVLKPLYEIAPEWYHPITGKSALTLLKLIKTEQIVKPLKP